LFEFVVDFTFVAAFLQPAAMVVPPVPKGISTITSAARGWGLREH
jgi:hypothetical protein